MHDIAMLPLLAVLTAPVFAPAQTAMRCWDALLCEGPKILFRIALALMKTHEELLLAQDNAGYVLRQMRLSAAATHDRDALMKARPRVPLPICCPASSPWHCMHHGSLLASPCTFLMPQQPGMLRR